MTVVAVGAKVPRGCLLLHIPLEPSNIQQALRSKGFDGNRPSVWIIQVSIDFFIQNGFIRHPSNFLRQFFLVRLQGLPLQTLAMFEEVLSVISGMIAKGCHFMGELPSWLVETEMGIEVSEAPS